METLNPNILKTLKLSNIKIPIPVALQETAGLLNTPVARIAFNALDTLKEWSTPYPGVDMWNMSDSARARCGEQKTPYFQNKIAMFSNTLAIAAYRTPRMWCRSPQTPEAPKPQPIQSSTYLIHTWTYFMNP